MRLAFGHGQIASQKRAITAITDEVLTFNNPTPSTSGYVRAELAWQKAK